MAQLVNVLHEQGFLLNDVEVACDLMNFSLHTTKHLYVQADKCIMHLAR